MGRAGRKAVKRALRMVDKPSFVIANAENAAGGFGLTKKVYQELLDTGVNVLTGGNHIWDKGQVSRERDHFKMLATPINLRKDPMAVVHLDIEGLPFTVMNVVGRVFMPPGAGDPFKAFDEIYEKEKCEGRVVIVDFHAEATSEKNALAEYVNGRAAAVIGTHTHVQTADGRILPNGTFFMSDAGSCCALNSILGMTVESSLARFLTEDSGRIHVELNGPYMFNGVELEIDSESKKVTAFKRLRSVIEAVKSTKSTKPAE